MADLLGHSGINSKEILIAKIYYHTIFRVLSYDNNFYPHLRVNGTLKRIDSNPHFDTYMVGPVGLSVKLLVLAMLALPPTDGELLWAVI